MVEGTTFSLSTNGDTWSLEIDPSTGEAIVLHKANSSSGGHETRRRIDDFLAVSAGKPEHDSLLQMLGSSKEDGQAGADEVGIPGPRYTKAVGHVDLGVERMVSADDNVVSTRSWDIDPMDAEAFWQANTEALAEKEKHEEVLHLPSVSDSDAGAKCDPEPQSSSSIPPNSERPDAT